MTCSFWFSERSSKNSSNKEAWYWERGFWRDALYDTLCVVVKFFSTAAPSIFSFELWRLFCFVPFVEYNRFTAHSIPSRRAHGRRRRGAIDLANDPLRTTATKKRVSPERGLERRPLWHSFRGSKVLFDSSSGHLFIFVVTPSLLRPFCWIQ